MGKQFMSPSEFGALGHFIESLPLLGVEPVAALVTEEEFIILLTGEARLKMGRKSDLELMYSNLSAFLNDEAIKAQTDFMQKISELDLRTENKVFYRFRE